MTEPAGLTSDFIATERERMLAAYQHMPLTRTPELYAPWQPAEMLMRDERMRVAAHHLRHMNVFPTPDDHCLEVGCGTRGWLADLTTWAIPPRALHGIEIDEAKVNVARAIVPGADLRVGDATTLPGQTTGFNWSSPPPFSRQSSTREYVPSSRARSYAC